MKTQSGEMLRSLNEMEGYTVETREGKVGSLETFIFDEESRVVRYVIVDTEETVSNGKILLPVDAINEESHTKRKLRASLAVYHPVEDSATNLDKKYRKGESQTTEKKPLRTTGEVIGYRVQTCDEKVGRILDFIADDETWVIRYILVDAKGRIPSNSFLIPMECVEKVMWSEERVYVDLA